MDLTPHIKQLLFKEDCVIIPGLGGFVTTYAPARIDRVKKVIHPPTKRVAFNEALKNNDGLLANLLANSQGLAYADALEGIKNEVSRIKTELKENGSFTFEGLGRLWMDNEEKIKFFYQSETNFLTNSFGLPEIALPAKPSAKPTPKVAPKAIPHPAAAEKTEAKVEKTFHWRRWVAAAAVLLLVSCLVLLQTKTINHANFSSINPFADSFKSSEVVVDNVDEPKVKGETADLDIEKATKPVEKAMEIKPTPSPAAKAPSAKAKKEIVNPAKFNFFIITGSFSSLDNAAKFKSQLIKKGYDDAEFCPVRKGIYYRIMVKGTFTRDEAETALAQVKKDLNPNAWIYAKK